MKKNLLTLIGVLGLLFTLSLVIGSIVSAQETTKDIPESKLWAGNGARGLEGAWTVTVTVRNCQTGAAIRTFPRMNTFMQGGTMQEFAAAVAPSLRGPGQGVWSFLYDGSFTYALHFLRFNADGTFAGSVVEHRSVQVSGDTYNATGTGEIYDANGNVVTATCATEAGSRFE
jgi:hypothetical protein